MEWPAAAGASFRPAAIETGTVCVEDSLFEDGLESLLLSDVLFVAAVAFVLAPLALARAWAKLFSPAKPNAVKNAIYECGLVSKGDAWMQFHSGYYLYAIIFLVFDVESVFLLPFAVAFQRLGGPRPAPQCWFLCCCWSRGWPGPGQGRADLGVKTASSS